MSSLKQPCCVHYSGGWGSSYRRQYVHVQIIINYMYLQNSSVWARLTDERVARDIMRFECGLTIHGKRDLKALSSEKIMINTGD